MGCELILNYCFGPPDSSIKLFPHASWVHYINHDGSNLNAEIRWSTAKAHKSHWLTISVESVLEGAHTWLILDVVGTREILEGEDLFINYGRYWEETW